MNNSQDAIWKARFSGLFTGLIFPILTVLTGLVLGVLCIPASILGIALSILGTLLFGIPYTIATGDPEQRAARAFIFPIGVSFHLVAAFATSILTAITLTGVASNRAYTDAFRTGEIHLGISDWWKGVTFSFKIVIAQLDYYFISGNSKRLDALLPPEKRQKAPLSYKLTNWILGLPLAFGFSPFGGLYVPVIDQASDLTASAIHKAKTEGRRVHLTDWSYESVKLNPQKLELEQLKIKLHELSPEFDRITAQQRKLLIELVERAGLDLCHKSSTSSYDKAMQIKDYVTGFVTAVTEGTNPFAFEAEESLREQIKERRKPGVTFFEVRGSPLIMRELEETFPKDRRNLIKPETSIEDMPNTKMTFGASSYI